MVELELSVFENGHLASYEPPQLIGVDISGDRLELSFDPVHSDSEKIETSIENLEHLSLTLD